MMYRIGVKNGHNILATEEEIINNAKMQEATGIKPLYAYRDFKNDGVLTAPGWLVVSNYNYGCIVVIKYPDDSYRIWTGLQGDFVCLLGGAKQC